MSCRRSSDASLSDGLVEHLFRTIHAFIDGLTPACAVLMSKTSRPSVLISMPARLNECEQNVSTTQCLNEGRRFHSRRINKHIIKAGSQFSCHRRNICVALEIRYFRQPLVGFTFLNEVLDASLRVCFRETGCFPFLMAQTHKEQSTVLLPMPPLCPATVMIFPITKPSRLNSVY